MSLSTFVIIFWKSARQLYRHYRPVQEAVDEIEEDDDLDFAPDPVGWEVAPVEVAAVVELAPVPVPTFEEEFEPEFDLEPAAAAAVPPGDIAPPPTPEELLTWPYVERRKANRPWSNRPAATVQAKVPDDLSAIDWAAYVPNVYSIDSTGWSVNGNKRWQNLHPDAWEDADRWLAEALVARRPRLPSGVSRRLSRRCGHRGDGQRVTTPTGGWPAKRKSGVTPVPGITPDLDF